MTDIINHPAHYTGVTAEIECIDIARHLNFQLGNAFKYVWRAGKKGGRGKEIEDLKKALWYLEDSIQNGYNDLDQCDIIIGIAKKRNELRHDLDKKMRFGELAHAADRRKRIAQCDAMINRLNAALEASNG